VSGRLLSAAPLQSPAMIGPSRLRATPPPRSCRLLSANKTASVMPESISFAVIFTVSASFPLTLPLPLGEKARC
jgi:hypothetical protein